VVFVAYLQNPWTIILIIAVALVVFASLLLRLLGGAYRKVGPNQALIVYGMNTGPHGRVVTIGGSFVFPMFQQATLISMELMSFDVAPAQALYTNQGVPVRVEAVTQLQVRSDIQSILTRAQQTANKPISQTEEMIRLVMEGHLRGVVGQVKVEDLVNEPEAVSERMRDLAAPDMANMGLQIVTFSIKQVHDDKKYIENMGLPASQRIQTDTDIAFASFQRELTIRKAEEQRVAEEQAAQQNMARVAAVTESEARQHRSRIDQRLKQADYDNEIEKHLAEISLIPKIESAIQQRRLAEEEMRTQEALMKQREMEYQVSTIAAAKTEAQRMRLMADAERQREILEAEGRAAARRTVAEAEAEATRLKGMAEAEVIRAKGAAEAEAMQVRAGAYREYGEAAMLDKLIGQLPEIVKGFAEPLAKVDKISIISTGGADGADLGVSRLTGDMVKMAGQAQGLIRALTGYDLAALMARIPGLNVVDAAPGGASGSAHTAANGHAGPPVPTTAAGPASPSPAGRLDAPGADPAGGGAGPDSPLPGASPDMPPGEPTA
jgi:flotillin